MHPRFRLFHLAVFTSTLTLATHVQAQITPISNEREVYGQVTIPGWDGHGRGSSMDPTDFGPFIASVSPLEEQMGPCDPPTPPDECVLTWCSAYAGQNSSFFGGGMQFSGEGAGSWDGETPSEYKFRSICKFRFSLGVPVDYTIQLAVDPGDLPPGQVFCSLEGPVPDITFHYTQYGILNATGTLGPGEYVLQGQTQTDWLWESFTSGGSYSGIFFVTAVDSLNGASGFPFDQTVACGGSATFSIGNQGLSGPLSYQWRRGLTPLSNDSHISGANSPNLTISNACTADAGYYSVVTTVVGSNPVVAIPSRFAQLSVVTTPTGVASDATPPGAPSFAPASPNPFQTETAMRYTVPTTTRVAAAVYDASGARVRELTNGFVSGSGSIAWDGRTQSGGRAPAGVYFVLLEAGSVRETKKVVLLK